MFSWVILVDKAVVAKKSFIFYKTLRVIAPKTEVYQSNIIAIMISFKQDNTLYCQISSWYRHWFDNNLR